MNKAPAPTGLSACRRCGTCCRKGGPALHIPDRPLIERGALPLRYLVTIRKGEKVHDPVRGGVRPVSAEFIKVKGGPKEWTCTFFDERASRCRIYANRPLECRLLKCWDTADLEEMYARDRLARRDVLENVTGLWDLVTAHEARCDVNNLAKLIERIGSKGDPRRRRAVAEIVGYDHHLRRLVVEKSRIDPAILDFLFGRALESTLKQL
jgi:Fe-S-cluster containining protein